MFHLRQSLLLSLGRPLLILGLLGLATPSRAPRTAPAALVDDFRPLWYAVHELSPLKPYPGFARYMLPLGASLRFSAAPSFMSWRDGAGRNASALVAAGMLLAAALPARYLSLRISGPVQQNPRYVISALDFGNDGRVAFDSYTRFAGPAGRLESGPPEIATADIS